MTALYSQLEDGIAYLLLPLKYVAPVVGPPPVPASGYLKGIVLYGGSLTEEREREQLRKGCPCILLQAPIVAPRKQTVGGMYRRDPKVTVLLCDSSRRGQPQQRRGSGHTGEPPGLYQMIEDAYDAITGKIPVDGTGTSLEAEPWKIVGESELLNEKDLQIVQLTFETSVVHDWPTVNRASLEDIEEAHGFGSVYSAGSKVYDSLEKMLNEWP